ncbi:unnamed protein product [Prorocentrum cordatum]|uniref:Protein O-GlcNAc transferase n=1 Tax=Prorocentrum cordatum TaxID=2364126 RepID=A0ABN9UYF5_9DINO|nr:unnamed protein product [Polarella glacialis]
MVAAAAACEAGDAEAPARREGEAGGAPGGGEGEAKKSPFAMALLHIKWASFLQRAGQFDRAVEHFTKSSEFHPNARAYFGLGTCLAALRRRQEAADALARAVELSPKMVAARVNLAGVLISLQRFEEGAAHCRVALQREPHGREAVMNLANALRNLGRRSEAIELVWEHIRGAEADAAADVDAAAAVEPSGVQTSGAAPAAAGGPAAAGQPVGGQRAAVRCSDWRGCRDAPLPLAVVCVKWGRRYGAEYVNRLHAGVRRHLPAERAEASFLCFTDDPSGLDEGIRAMPLPEGLPLWWGKAHLFSEEAGLDGHRVLYLDLDQVIVGSLAPLVSYEGPFALLSTDGIACELAGGGYNSSVVSWEASPFFRAISAGLSEAVLRFVHRFDHWLEMSVEGADLWQLLQPGCVVDYTAVFRGGVCLGSGEDEEVESQPPARGEGEQEEGAESAVAAPHCAPREPPQSAAVVTFPRNPKPHDVAERHDWVRLHWIGHAG